MCRGSVLCRCGTDADSAARAITRSATVVKPNYQFEKRQKELEKKKKQEQKRLRKLAGTQAVDEEAAESANPVVTDDTEAQRTN